MSTPDEDTTTRRNLLGTIWIGLGAIVTTEVVWVVSGFLRPRRRRISQTTGDSLVIAGPVERFEPGSVTAFQRGKFYLVRLPDGGFLALHRECTHLGCTVPWVDGQQQFICPCHASTFDIQGAVLGPPAPRPLDLFPVRIENNIVKVETREPIKRTVVSADQAVHA